MEKLSVNELKDTLKKNGMSQTGDKGTLVHRLRMFETCSKNCLVLQTSEGDRNPCTLKMAELRTYASREGVSPIGSQDEILEALINVLEKKKKLPTVSSVNHSVGVDPIDVAKRVLEMGETEDFEGILSLLGPSKITKSSPVGVMRKAYLKLSLLIHPDKIGRQFGQATKAFQYLVQALESLSSEEKDEEESRKESKQRNKAEKTRVSTISRSNDNCFRTRVCCPRCKEPWSEGTLDGNPDYCYNFLMQGLKRYTCSTCLCEFGCMTAVHKCPHCNRGFEYTPLSYHSQVTCPHSRCGKKFGFFLFLVSDRVMNDLMKEVKALREERVRNREAKLRRQNRAKSRVALSAEDNETAFILGLIDGCPRCGESFEGYPDEESQRLHLLNCTDSSKHQSHRKRSEEACKKAADREERRELQEDVEAQAAWTLLGSSTSTLWLLIDCGVRQRADALGLDSVGSKEEVISRIVANEKLGSGTDIVPLGCERKRRREEDGTTSLVRSEKKHLSTASLPSNLHSMSLSQLRSVVASHGMPGLDKLSKSELIDVIENEIFD